MPPSPAPHDPPALADSRYAVLRLMVTLALMTVGASGMYMVAVVLPAVQAEFGVARADASLPYTLLMIGFGIGGMLMGRWCRLPDHRPPRRFQHKTGLQPLFRFMEQLYI